MVVVVAQDESVPCLYRPSRRRPRMGGVCMHPYGCGRCMLLYPVTVQPCQHLLALSLAHLFFSFPFPLVILTGITSLSSIRFSTAFN
jgi:hypothetical protein